MEGIVKWFNRKKGFGFIQGEDGQDYFVHYTAVEKGTFLRDNDKVAFDNVETDKGKQAQNVKLLQKASEMGGEQPVQQTEEFEQSVEEPQETEEFDQPVESPQEEPASEEPQEEETSEEPASEEENQE